jgi:RHS repeat-associated protein
MCVGVDLPDGTPCPGSDNPCMPHACSGGACTAFVSDGDRCNDDNPCTVDDTCGSSGVCQGTPNTGASCDDGDACNGVEICSAGACIPGTAVDVDDHDTNTMDACDPMTGQALHVDCSSQLDLSVSTTLAALAKCLYVGQSPIQAGIVGQPFPLDLEPLSEDAPFKPNQIAVLRGEVTTHDGVSLDGVTIEVIGQSTSGKTFTRADGRFDMAVHGGGLLTVSYTKPGYLTVQRQVQTAWTQVATLPNVALLPFDTNATVIDLSGTNGTEIQVAQGRVINDDDGRRQATMLFRDGTSATMKVDGVDVPLETLTIRATEYTEGDRGPEAMPAVLPPAVAYTYCLELSADEAVAAGATGVEFSEPVVFYVENFLGFPVGDIVPAGSYDRVKQVWVPEKNGKIVRVLSIDASGSAQIDTDGDDLADNDGIDPEERERLGALYAPSTSLWRVEMNHFTPWDLNWPFGPPPDACQPGVSSCDLGEGPQTSQPEENTCTQDGSIIECQNQTLGERVPITGTPFSLNYRSDRVPGRRDGRTLTIPVTGTNIPASVRAIEVEVDVAGQRISQSFACPSSPQCAPSQSIELTWDGKDAYARKVQGLQTASVRVGYTYEAVYRQPAELAASFGAFGTAVTGVKARQELTIWNTWQRSLGTLTLVDQGLGGWSLSEHHTYDLTGKLYLGDGTRRDVAKIEPTLQLVAGGASSCVPNEGGRAYETSAWHADGIAVHADETIYYSGANRIRKISPSGVVTTLVGFEECLDCDACGGYNGDGPAATTRLALPSALAVAPDGSIYFSDAHNYLIRRLTPQGMIETIAGVPNTGYPNGFYSEDGAPALSSQIAPGGLAWGPDGLLYFTDRNRIRRIVPAGDGGGATIETVVGLANGGSDVDGQPALNAYYLAISSIAFDPSGRLYFNPLNCIRRVELDGTLKTVGGHCGPAGTPVEGTLATAHGLQAPLGLSIGSDGSVYFKNYDGPQILRIGPDGILNRVAGLPVWPPGSIPCGVFYENCGAGGPAAAAKLHAPSATALGSDGSLYFTAWNIDKIFRVAPGFPGVGVSDIAVPSEDGSQVYVFDAHGTHKTTRDAHTGATLFQFDYDSVNRLIGVQDVGGLITSIHHDSTSGAPTEIVGPYGDTTLLDVEANGYLESITNPAGEAIALVHDQDGLLLSFTDPRGNEHIFEYDALGRLSKDSQPTSAGGFKTLTRTKTPSGHEVTIQSAGGVATTYAIDHPKAGGQTRMNTLPNGLTSEFHKGTDGVERTVLADGTEVTVTKRADPRFGLLAPILSQATKLLSGKTLSVTRSRTITLAEPNDHLSLTKQVDTTELNGQPSERFTTTLERVGDGWTRTEQSPLGRTSVSTLDADGRTIAVDVPGLAPSEFSYDAHGRLASVMRGARIWTRSYDSVTGLLADVTDPLGRLTTFDGYDLARRLVSQTLPGARTVGFSYDASGNQALMSLPAVGDPPTSAEHAFAYTSIDQLASYDAPDVAPSFGITSYAYDLDGRLTTMTRPDGLAVSHTYDTAGRLMTTTLPAAQGALTRTYSAATGTLRSIQGPDAATEVQFTYDGSLLTETEVDPGDFRVHRDYDDHLRLACECLNGTCSLVGGVCTGGSYPITIGYDLDGLLIQAGELSIVRDLSNGMVLGSSVGIVHEALTPNAHGERQGYVARAGDPQTGEALLTINYARDALGRILQKTEIFGASAGGGTRVFEYGYDPAGRLQAVSEDGVHVAEYSYDANGNRLSRSNPSIPGSEVAGEYDAQDRLVAYGAAAYTYTANGELAQKVVASDVTTYSYDALGNLRGVSLPDGRTVTYTVDGENHRLWKAIDGVRVQGFLWRGALQVVAELDGAGNVVARFVYGDPTANVPDYMVTANGMYRLLKDHLGSPRVVVNTASGAVVQRMDYDEFGRVLVDTNPGWQPFGFAGGLWDADTGLVRFGARDYDAETGRWTSKDPIRFAGGDTNLYGYVGGDGVNGVDPLGLYGTNDCEYYQFRCFFSGGTDTYYCDVAPLFCNLFPKAPDPDPSDDYDDEGFSRCMRQCLQDRDNRTSCDAPPSTTYEIWIDHISCATDCIGDNWIPR